MNDPIEAANRAMDNATSCIANRAATFGDVRRIISVALSAYDNAVKENAMPVYHMSGPIEAVAKALSPAVRGHLTGHSLILHAFRAYDNAVKENAVQVSHMSVTEPVTPQVEYHSAADIMEAAGVNNALAGRPINLRTDAPDALPNCPLCGEKPFNHTGALQWSCGNGNCHLSGGYLLGNWRGLCRQIEALKGKDEINRLHAAPRVKT